MDIRTHPRLLTRLFFPVFLLCILWLSGCTQPLQKASVAQAQIPRETEFPITIGEDPLDPLVQELTITDADPSQLEQALPLLPHLEKLTLEGKIPAPEKLLALKEKFPQVTLICPLMFGGKPVRTDAQQLDLTGTAVSAAELEKFLPLFSSLQTLILVDVPLTDAEKMALADGLPDVFVRYELPIAGQYFSTDLSEIDLSGCPVTVEEIEEILPYFSRLEKVDMSYCGIADEEMDRLNRLFPDISIVWTLKIGQVHTPTDAIYFYPAEANYYPTNAEMEKLRYCTELIAVDIGHTRATDCEFLWHTPKVKYLILADTGITDITPVGNLQDLIYLELFNLRIDDYSPLLSCTKLQDLNIGTTHADPEPLSKMTWLHNLQWHRADQNPATKEAVLQLPQQLPDTNVELYPKKKARNIGGPWRYLPNYYVFRDLIGAPYYNQDQITDYWGEEDGRRILACENGKGFAADTLAEIVRERIQANEPIIGLKDSSSEKAQILHKTLQNARP